MSNRAHAENSYVELEASLEKAGRVEELIRLYETRAREVPGVEEAGHLLTRAAELARERLKNHDRAEGLLRHALTVDPNSREALQGLRYLYEQKQDAAGQAELLEQLAGTTRGAEAAALLLKAADLYEHKLSRRDRAILCCQLASRAEPRERQAFARSRQLFLSDGRYLSAFESLQREHKALGGRDLAEEYLTLAERLVDDPTEHELAGRALTAGLALEPEHPRALKLKKALAGGEADWRERAKALKASSLEERDRRAAARQSLLVAKLFAFYEPKSGAKVKEALDRCFLLWPAMPDALHALEQMAQKSNDFEGCITQLKKLAGESKDKSAQADLWVRIGTLRLTHLEDRAGALAAFEKAATVDPSRGDAVSLAAELLLESGKAAEAVALFERLLATLKDRFAVLSLHLRLSDLCTVQAKDPARALTHLEAAFKLDASQADVAFKLARAFAEELQLERLEPLLELAVYARVPVSERIAFCESVSMLFEENNELKKAARASALALYLDPSLSSLLSSAVAAGQAAGALPELAVALRRAGQVSTGTTGIEVWRSLAQLLEGSLQRSSEAEAAWREVLKRDPADAAALTALQALKQVSDEAVSTDPRSRLEAEAKRLEGSAADPSEAAAIYRQILAIDADDLGALKRLGSAAAAISQWEEVARVAERLMALAETPAERREWRGRLAQLCAERLSRKEEGAGLYLTLLAEGDGSGAVPASVVAGLERLASQGIRQAEISQALAPHYAQNGDHQRQVASLLVQLSTVQDKDEQKGLLTLLANTSEKHLLDSRAAFEFRLRGLHVDPSDSTFRAEALRLARDLSAHPELARALVDLGNKVEDATLATSLMHEAAELAEEGGAIDDAAAALNSALVRSPEDPLLLASLGRLYFKAGRHSDCDLVLRRRLALTEGEDKAPLYVQLSEVNAELARPVQAAQALQEAIRWGGSEGAHLPRLCELLEQGGRLSELSSALGRQIEMAEAAGDADTAARLSLKRAQVLEASIGDRGEAVKRYSQVLAGRPSDPDALAALEHMLQDPACREEAARALVPAYDAVKDHRKVVHALNIVADATADSLEKVQALQQAAYIHTHHLRQPEQAFAALATALRLSPSDAAVRAAVRQAAEDADALDSYAEVVAELLESDVGPAAAPLHQELAEVYERKLNDRESAIKHLDAVLEHDPKNDEALRSLQRVHRAAEAWGPLAGVLERLAAICPEPSEKISYWREAAQLHETRLTDKESAAVTWRQIAGRDPLDRQAASALDRLSTELDRPQELAFALELRRNQEGQSPQGRELAFRLAELRQKRLGDNPGALLQYRQILAEDPAHTGAREALEAWARASTSESAGAMEILDPVLAQFGDHQRRIDLREARMGSASGSERARLGTEIRAIYERDLGQPQAAFMSALKVFTDGVDRELIRPDLERLARETGSFEDLAEIYESAASELLPGDSETTPLLRRAAELREQLGQNEDAIRVWSELLVEAPKDRQALDSLGRLYERTQNAKSLSAVYATKAQMASDPAERFALLLKGGEAHEAAGDDEAAIDCLKAALAIRKSPEALAALDRLFGKARRFNEQADVLDQLAELAGDDETRKGHLLRRAQLLEREGQFAEALRGYGTALELAPGEPNGIAGLERMLAVEAVRLEAARLLEPLYRKQKDQRKLVEVLDLRLSIAEPKQRKMLLAEVATLREALGQKSQAFAARMRAFTENPDSKEARDELARLAADTGSFEELASVYEDQLERGVGDALAEDLWRRLAVLYTDRLARPDLAARAWSEVAERDPKNPLVLDALARLYRKTRMFKELGQVMRRQLGLETVPSQQISLLFELASLAEESLLDKALAAQCYQEILERKPDDPNAIKFLGRVLSESERYPELATLITKEIQLAESAGASEEAFELAVRLGRLKLQRLGDPRGALNLFQSILKRRSAHPGAVGALEEMARSDSSLRGEAASALEPIFASGGEYLKAVQMLESRASAEPVPQEKAALLRKVAELYVNQMSNAEMAFLAATRALREVPDDERSLELCLSLVDRADAHDELAAMLTEVASKAANDPARMALYRTLARLQHRQGESEEATESWKRVLELNPSDGEALEGVAHLLKSQHKVPELLEVLRRQLSIADDADRRAALLFQIGSLQDSGMNDGMGALATFRRLLELKPDDPKALAKMDELCEQQERWPELADVLARRIRAEPNEPHLELKLRLSTIREVKLLDKFGALDLYTEMLAAQPNHAGALDRLEAMVAREPQNQSAVDVLLRAYRTNGDLAKLSQLIEARAAVSADPRERKELLEELAQLRQTQGEPELAYLALWRAFKEDPNDAELRKRLEAAADAAKTYEELTTAYEEELPRIAETTDAADMCLKLGFVLDQRLSEADKAVYYFEKARQLDPNVWPKALPALDRLYNQLDRPAQLVPVLEALIGFSNDKQEKVGLLFRLGQLCHERLENDEAAVVAYENILMIDAKHIPAARLLEGLYESSNSHDKLYGILKLQRELVTSAPERERVLSKMAQVSAEGLSNTGHSIEIYRELLAKNPRNEQAMAALEGQLEKAGRFEELKELIQGRLSQTVDPRELVRLNDRLGSVLAVRLDRPEEAIAYFKAALERDARHKGALESLKEIYGKLGKNDELVVVLRRLVPLQETAQGVKAIRIRLAEILAEMGRREEALDACRRALEVEPHQVPEMDRVYGIFTALKATPDAARALELRAHAEVEADDKDEAVKTWFQIADLWRSVGKVESAGPALQKVLELDPANRTAYEQATELFSKVNDWRSYAQVMDRYLVNLVTEEEKISALRELARVQEYKLGQKDVAFLQECRALQLNPSDHTIREEVERLASETGSYEELAAVYDEVADDLPRGPLAERIYLVLAKVHDQQLDDPAASEGALRRILEFDPTNEQALDALASMFSRRGRHKEYIVALEQKLEAADSIEKRKEILREISKVFDERLEDPAEACQALLRALDLDPDTQTLDTLAAIYRRQQQWDHVASTLLRARDLAGAPEERARLQTEVAQLYERDLGDDEAAIVAYSQALELDPTHRDAIDALERLYTKHDRPAELLAVYERQLDLAGDSRDRVKVLFKSAAIWEDRYQHLANADACVEAVLTLDDQNLQAIKTLERLRKAQGRWDELIHVVDRHIHLLSSPEEQAELCVEMGDVFHQQLKQVDRAVTTYQQALELNPECRPAMHALGTLYERSGNWPFALDMLSREARVAGATAEAVELFHRMGKINEDMLLDPGSAKACYLEALRIDPGYLPCIRALKGIHEIEKDWASYEKAIVQEAQETEDPEAKSRALLDVARYHAENKDDRESAAHYYEEALRLQPDSLEAARSLADIYIAREDWDASERMLDIVAVKMAEQAVAEQDPQLAKDLCRQLYRLGYVSEKLANKDKALRSYEKAYQLDATYLPALEGLGNLLVQAHRYEEALKVYQTILIHHRDDLTDLEVVEIYWQLGDIHNAVQQYDRAHNHFEKALAIDPHHEPSLRALVNLAEAAGKFDRSMEYRQKLLGVLDGDSKFAMAVELGKLARDKVSDVYTAIDAFMVAHKLRPKVLEVMDSLYILYRETKQGQKAAELLQKMLAEPELKKEPQKAKRVYFALGEIARDELKEVEGSVKAFNKALDLDFRFIEAFSAIEALLGQNKKWKELEENYQRMISRLPKTDEFHGPRMTLFKALGDLYLKVLKQPDNALLAYSAVAQGLPDDAAIQEVYADLAAKHPGHEDRAVIAYRRALPQTTNPGRVASALAELAARKKDYDSAYLAAQVVNGLIGEAGPGEREILSKLTPYAKKKEVAQRALTDRLWQTHLFHPKVRGTIGEMMAILFEQAGHLYKAEFAQYQINPKRHLIDVAAAQEYHIHHFRYVARLLGMEQVALFSPFLVGTREKMAKRSNDPPADPTLAIEICHTHPVSLKVGGKFFGETGQKEVYYMLGRAMALLRPELALSQRLSPERLEAVFQAAISLSVDTFRFNTENLKNIETERKALERTLPEPARAALARVTREYVRTAAQSDLRDYLEGAELSAVRTGLFVAGEIEPVKKMVLGESGAAYRVQARSKIRDLMVFALSEDLHALRVAVGTHVEVQIRK